MASIDHEWHESRGDRRLRAPRAGMPRAGARRALRGAVMAAGLVAVALATRPFWPARAPPEPQAAAPLAPFWQGVTRLRPVFVLPGIAHIAAARSHTGKAGEEDSLILGGFAETPLHARLIAERPGAEPRARISLYVDLVRRAGEEGLALQRIAQPFTIETRLGAIEAAEAVLATGTTMRACLVMRSVRGDDALRLSGWLCAAEPPATEAATLRCLVDALALADPREHPDLARLMGAAQPRPGSTPGPACTARLSPTRRPGT